MRRLALSVLVAMLAACGSSGPAPADVPPPGQIWFGSSFDTTTFVLSGRSTTLPLGSQVAFVARLTRPSKGEVVGLQLNVGGTPATWPGGTLAAGSDVMGQVLPAAEVYQPGPLRVEVVDVGGNVLASGTVTISP